MKACSICLKTISVDQEIESSSYCKTCRAVYMREWRSKNREKVQQNNKKWYANGGADKKKIYDSLRLDKVREDNKKRYLLDAEFRLKKVLRTRINKVLCGLTKSGKSKELLGCDVDFYIRWIEYQLEPSMTWQNYGVLWNIDHVRPCCSYNLSNPEEQIECFNWKNTRPLMKTLNESKSNKIDYDLINKHKLIVTQFLTVFESVPRNS
jgi:hypothetical protein